ncbi:transposase [Bradyrhizobium sp. 186]|nr:transposase [Bradyrhizobium sp. 186]
MDARGFAAARDFAAWTGLTPRAQSSGGKERLGAVSKRGNRHTDALDRWCDLNHQAWQARLESPALDSDHAAKTAVKLIAVTFANKIARTICVLLVRGGIYHAPPAMLKT